MEDSLVVEEGMLVKFLLFPFATCLLHLQILLQGSFHQDEVIQPHCRDTQRPKIINFWGLLRHQITCHFPPFPVYQNSVTTVAKTSVKKQPVPKAHVGGPWIQTLKKILQDKYLVKLQAHQRISFVISYIIFKTKISFKEHMNRGAHLLANEPTGIEGRFVR